MVIFEKDMYTLLLSASFMRHEIHGERQNRDTAWHVVVRIPTTRGVDAWKHVQVPLATATHDSLTPISSTLTNRQAGSGHSTLPPLGASRAAASRHYRAPSSCAPVPTVPVSVSAFRAGVRHLRASPGGSCSPNAREHAGGFLTAHRTVPCSSRSQVTQSPP